jgi:enolase
MFIKDVKVGSIKDSRGEKTVEVLISTLKGKFVASAPSGKSKGKHEARAYSSRGFNWSMKMLNVFVKSIRNRNFKIRDFEDLKELEDEIRKFESQFGKIGANFTYALETSFLKASAAENKMELWEFIFKGVDDKKKPNIPRAIGNCIGGGLHSDSKIGEKPDFQEFEVVCDGKSFSRGFTKGVNFYDDLKFKIRKHQHGWIMHKNDENAWKTNLNNEEVLEIMFQMAKKTKVKIGLDVASSSFFKGGYHYENKKLLRDRAEQIDYIKRIIEKYELFYIEDPLEEEDFSGFGILTKAAKKIKKGKVLIVGDDLTVTNVSRLKRAIRNKSINAMIVKPNQNGYLLDVAKVVSLCKKYKIKIIFSHRSGETMDDALADYAVGFGADYVKTGIDGRERLVKLRRIIDIERGL